MIITWKKKMQQAKYWKLELQEHNSYIRNPISEDELD